MSGHCLLTGGAGFIGSATARALVQAGWHVVVLDKLTYAGRREHLDGVAVDLVVGDVCDEDLVRQLVVGADAVVHAAAESHVGRALQDPTAFLKTNIDGTRTVLEESAKAGVPHVVHLSTDEVFGSAPAGQSFAIDAPLRPGNAYAASKAAAEAFVHATAHTLGSRATIVRCTNNYGPRQHIEKAIPGWIRAALDGEALQIHGDGSAVRDWLHVEDFAAGLLAVLSKGTPGDIYHFSGHNPLANKSVAAQIADMCGGAELTHVADRPGQDARYALDDAGTRTVLEWAPYIPFAAGLKQTLEWIASQRRAA
jgi:dTDP-glucose 4,6-dehydratase